MAVERKYERDIDLLLAEEVSDLLHPDMTVHQTRASAAIRLEVEGFSIDEGVEIGLPRVRQAFEASANLINFYRKHKVRLDQSADEATTVEAIQLAH